MCPSVCFHPLTADTPPPAAFTYPFCYTPHPLARLAAARLQTYIATRSDWLPELRQGKMFGVCVVRAADGQLGYIAAYSGYLMGRADWPGFVPPILDTRHPGADIEQGVRRVEQLTREIERLEISSERRSLAYRLSSMVREAEEEESAYRGQMAEAKRERDRLRSLGTPTDDDALVRQSRFMKAELRRLRRRHNDRQADLRSRLSALDRQLTELHHTRRALSDRLQAQLFTRFTVSNARGLRRSLTDIFADAHLAAPPSGAGECSGPRLLQYAYDHHLQPLCMAEFWVCPNTDTTRGLRRHLQYYPACHAKCGPVLSYMLQGLRVDPNPLVATIDLRPVVVYEDDCMAVVAKPAGLLAVPGVDGLPNVVDYMGERWEIDADNRSGLIVHRLDMDTSGLMIVARTAYAQRRLQAQFAAGGSVKKMYRAVVEQAARIDAGQQPLCVGDRGRIALPLSPDLSDRPRQQVDAEQGKEAVTDYEVIEADHSQVTLLLYPLTGRTHQLRVHCASPQGLNAPIRGDRLYGLATDTPAGRLHLHAERIAFVHPATGQPMVFSTPPEW